MNARGERTRARLIRATIDVVNDVGYARATTKAIADAAGVAEGTIYRHYPDKRGLFYAAVLDRNAAVLDWITGLPERAGAGTVRGNLLEALEQLGRLRTDLLPLELWLRSDPELGRDMAAVLADLPSTTDRPHTAARGVEANPASPQGLVDADASALPGPPQFLARYLAAERRLGRIRATTDTDRVAVLLLMILFGIAMTAPVDGRAVDGDVIGFAIDTVLHGIGPDDGARRAGR